MPVVYRHRPGRPKPHYVIERPHHGKERAKAFETREEADEAIELLRGEERERDGWLTGPMLPVDAACRGWLLNHGPTLAPSTRATAHGLVERLAGHFGTRDLRHLTETDLIGFAEATITQARKAKPPRKGTAVSANALSILRTVCSHHVRAGLLDRNPAASARKIAAQVSRGYEPEVREVDSWSGIECEALLELGEKHERHLYGPLLFLLHTGCRRGEVLGLRWEKVDLRRQRVSIARSRVRGQDKTPKSGKARTVPLSPPLTKLLRGLARKRPGRQGLHTDPGYVFLAPSGGQWDEGNFGRAWRRLRARAAKDGVRPLKLHCTRHTFASLALEGGRSIYWVSRVLGHANPELTLRTYSHVLERDEEDLGFLPGVEVKARRKAG